MSTQVSQEDQQEAIRKQIEAVLEAKQAQKDVCLAFCSPSMIHAKFVESVITLLQSYPRLGWISQSIGGPAMALARQSQVLGFINDTKADYLLMIDSDMVFEAKHVDAVLALDADYTDKHPLPSKPQVYTGLYVSSAGTPIVGQWDKDKTKYLPLDKPPTTPIRVGAAGAGFLLIPRRVFDYFPAESAFNEIAFGPQNDQIMGEDISFCHRLDKAGIDLILDPSVYLGHCKETIVYPDGERVPV